MLTIDFEKLDIRPGSRVLDVGCGPGRHSWEAFSLKGVNVVAVDMDFNVVRFADFMLESMVVKGLSGGGAHNAAAVDASRLPFADSSFDCVICSEVLEHVPDDGAAVREFARVLKPGGMLAASVPLFLPEIICWNLCSEYTEMAGGHVRIYRKDRLEKLFRHAGLECNDRVRAHALHSPLWWLKCLARANPRVSFLAKGYEKFINWHVMNSPRTSVLAEKLLAPVLAKSIVYYLTNQVKKNGNEAKHVA